MVIAIVAGPGEGKSGTAYWLTELLRKLGANVTIHDSETTAETDAQIKENVERIMKFVLKTQKIHVVTKLKSKDVTDKALVSSLQKAGVLEA